VKALTPEASASAISPLARRPFLGNLTRLPDFGLGEPAPVWGVKV
jgi:hypothetical protein